MPLTSTVVLQRLSNEQMPVDMVAGRDEWWHEVVPAADASCPVEWVESEAPLFVLYTSGCVLFGDLSSSLLPSSSYLSAAPHLSESVARCPQVDGQAQGCPAHDGRLYGVRCNDLQIHL